MSSQARPARPEEIERALRALPVEYQAGRPALIFQASDHKDELFMWVYDRDPASVVAGEVYDTVFLRFTPGRKPHVAQFRSRRRADGDDDTIL